MDFKLDKESPDFLKCFLILKCDKFWNYIYMWSFSRLFYPKRLTNEGSNRSS